MRSYSVRNALLESWGQKHVSLVKRTAFHPVSWDASVIKPFKRLNL